MLAVDWVEVLAELRRMGYSLRAIAEHIELAHSNLVLYAQGTSRPLHATGERLVAFYLQATGKVREQVPMTRELPRGAAG